VSPEEIGLSASRLGRVDEMVRRWVDKGTVAGAITLVCRRGRIGHLACHGYLDLETRRPMREDAIFRIYSMTKIVTSVAVLMLLEEGRFLLTDDVSRFIPEFKDLRVAVTGADGQPELIRPRREVTLHDLLTHTGGLTYEGCREAVAYGKTLQQFVADFCKIPLCRHPGEAWNYSASVDVLGRVIEVVTGRSFDVFLQERIFTPLGMTDTAFWVPPGKRDRFATMYKPGADGRLVACDDLPSFPDRKTPPYTEPPAFLSGGGGLVSTTSDMLRLGLMLLGGGQWNGVRLLSRKTVELMTADHLPAGHPPIQPFGFGFGLGVSVARRLGELRKLGSIGEFGWGGAACTQIWIDPVEDMIPMIMLQYQPVSSSGLVTDLFKHLAYQAIND
jgi:CubicO group peptidase (beta-lactamase class C family)